MANRPIPKFESQVGDDWAPFRYPRVFVRERTTGPDRAALVYDHHNVIFAYGPLDAFVRVLEHKGFAETAEIVFPATHRHQFRGDFDEHERKITQALGWQHSPLRNGDDY